MSICDCNQGRLPCSCKPVMEPCQLVARPSQQGRTYEALVQAQTEIAVLREELAATKKELGRQRGRANHLGREFVALERRLAATDKPTPISVDLSELREYHTKAVSNLKSYADDAGLRDSDIKHYTKRAAFHEEMVALIDKVKELNQ